MRFYRTPCYNRLIIGAVVAGRTRIVAFMENTSTSLQVDSTFAALVREAFAVAHDLQTLGRHPLATSSVVQAALVLDPETPTIEEWGRALYLVLWWATERLAPEVALAASPGMGQKTHTTPPIRERHWARYNLLRYLYLQPDLLTLDETGPSAFAIGSAEAYYEERSRAFAEAAQWLARQRDHHTGDERIRALALEQALEPALGNKSALHLLGIASLFSTPVTRTTLLAMAAGEHVANPEETLHWLLAHRYLHTSASGALIAMAEPLREHLALRQPRPLQQGRHQIAANLAGEAGDAVAAAYHLIEGGSPQLAASTLLDAPAQQRADGIALLARRLSANQVAPADWRSIQMLRADIAQESGQPEESMAIWRDLLKSVRTTTEQAELYLRMGRLVARRDTERSNEQALTIYQMGLDRLAAEPDSVRSPATVTAPASEGADSVASLRAELLKEMAWLQIHAQDWRAAEETIRKALALLSTNERSIRAELYDALSTLRRNQDQYADAIEHARAALVLREGMGDFMRLGRSYNSLGILYRITEEFEHAIQAYQKALAIFQRLDNAALVATTMLNIGTAFHFTERLEEAERWYRRCLLLADEAGLSVTEVRAHANLFEALTALGKEDEARLHWRSAWARSLQLGLEGEVDYLRQVAERDALLLQEMQEDARMQGGDRSLIRPVAPETESSALLLESAMAPESSAENHVDGSPGAIVSIDGEPAAIDAWMAGSTIVQRGLSSMHRQEQTANTPPIAAREQTGNPITREGEIDAAINGDHTSPRLQFGAALDVSEARLLEMLNHLDTINVATVMDATGASKATATRKLAHLVEKGLLVRHGQGRATYYSRAHGIPAVVVAGDLAGLQSRLDMVALRFAQEYNLVRARAVGVRYGFRSDGDAEVCYEVRVSFTRNPLLDDFFALERALSRATGSRIQLTL